MVALENPRIPGLDARFTHLASEDPPWIAVRSQTQRRRQRVPRVGAVARVLGRPAVPGALCPVGPGHDRPPPWPPQPAHAVRAGGRVRCGVQCGVGHPHRVAVRRRFGPFVAGPDGVEALRGDDGRPPVVERRARGDGRRPGRARRRPPLPGPAHRVARRPRGSAGRLQCRCQSRRRRDRRRPWVSPPRSRAPAHHLGRRPRARAAGPVAARAARVACGTGGPTSSPERVKLEFKGGHYGFERDARRRLVRPLAVRRPRRAHRPAARPGRHAARASSATSPPPTRTSAPAPTTRPRASPT